MRKPIARVGRLGPTTDSTYRVVVEWVVSGKKGELKEVSMTTNVFAKTLFSLTVGKEAQFSEKKIQSALMLPFPENELGAGQGVTLLARSEDGTTITVDGSITGAEE